MCNNRQDLRERNSIGSRNSWNGYHINNHTVDNRRRAGSGNKAERLCLVVVKLVAAVEPSMATATGNRTKVAADNQESCILVDGNMAAGTARAVD